MGDMKDFFDAHREMTRQRREARAAKYEPMLKQSGAVWKSDGIWEFNGWFCYPSKGYAMLKTNPRVRKPLRLILKAAKKNEMPKFSVGDKVYYYGFGADEGKLLYRTIVKVSDYSSGGYYFLNEQNVMEFVPFNKVFATKEDAENAEISNF